MTDNFFDDQILYINKKQIKRAKYQASLVKKAVSILGSKKLVEVGAGKGLTSYYVARSIKADFLGLQDPGKNRYKRAWKHYICPNISTNKIERLKNVNFDLGFTFFSLEHAEYPKQELEKIIMLLKPQSIFFGAVPWLNANPGDLLVADHCSHFTDKSLTFLLNKLKKKHKFHFAIMIDQPLRALLYFISKSKSQLKILNDKLFKKYTNKSKKAKILKRFRDFDLYKIAMHHWRVNLKTWKEKNEVLWGAGFYSKIICLRHKHVLFSYLIDNDKNLTKKEFLDSENRKLKIIEATKWIKKKTNNTQIWFGVSKTARSFILKQIEKKIENEKIKVVF